MRRGLLADIDEIRALDNRLGRRPFNQIYGQLTKRCSLILESAPISEALWQRQWKRGVWSAALQAARTSQGRMLDLLLAHHIDPNPAYRDRAMEELRNLTRWSSWVDPCHTDATFDLCTAEIAVSVILALDWLWDDLREEDRKTIKSIVHRKAVGPYLQAVGVGAWWLSCYHHWNAVINSSMALVGLALSDESEDAAHAHRSGKAALDHFFDALGKEGGWDEGTGYWGYAMRYLLLYGEVAARLEDDHSIFHRRGMDSTGSFPVYFTPNGQPAGFGDQPSVPLYGELYLLVKHLAGKEVLWWLDQYAFHRDVSTTGWASTGLALLFRPETLKTPGDPQLEPVKVFKQIGWAAMADHWPRPDLYVSAKTGDLAANHSQRDMNSVQIQVDGEILLSDPGSPVLGNSYVGNGQGEYYEAQARSHNTIVVGRRDHQIDARGELEEFRTEKHLRWLTCLAGNACGDSVHFYRHVLMLLDPRSEQGQAVIVLDEVTNAAAEKLDLYWHSLKKMDFDPKRCIGTVTGTRASLHFGVACSSGQAVTELDAHSLGPKGTDYALKTHCPKAAGRVLLVTLFSREEISGAPSLREESDGTVFIEANGATAAFEPNRHGLKLTGVTRALPAR
ncbi:MAG: heparinase II/III family protein [Phycisphaerae bacterium]